MWLINTYGNGLVLSDVFRAIVFLMGGGYESLLRLGMLCLVFGGIVAYLGRGRIHWQWAIGAVMILAVTMNIRTTIQVHDLVNPSIGDQVIGGVPLAVAFPAYMTSEISYQTMVAIETAFGVPVQYRVVNSTIGKGFFDMQKALSLELIPGDLQANVTNYIKDCVFPAIQLNRLNRETLLDAADMVTAINVNVAALVTREVLLGNQAGEITCPDLYDRWVRQGLANGQPDYDETMRQFRSVLNEQDVPDAELTTVQVVVSNIMGSGQGARTLINNVLLRERWKNAEEAYAQDGSDTASAVVQMTRSISEDIKNQAYADSMVAGRFVPLIRTVSESAVYLLTPLMLALAMSPAMFATIRGAVMSYGWLFMWIPMYAIFNFVTLQYGVQQMNMITVNQVTFNSYDQYYDVLLGLNTFMARLIWAVPTLATVVTYGMASAASSLTGSASGAQLAATEAAHSYAKGEGHYAERGQHLKEEHSPMVQDASGGFHAGESYFSGGTGVAVHRQDGTSSYAYSDGSALHVGRNGMEQYHGPEGSWSKRDGVYQAGVWRQDVHDADGKSHLAQFEVSGDHVDVSYMKRDGHGVQHDVRETWNQSLNQQKSVSDTWSEGGFTKELRTQGDHSQLLSYSGTASVPMTVNGRTKMVKADVTGSFSRPSPHDDWGHGVMTAHSTEHGDHRYALSDVPLDDRGLPNPSQGMTVTSSDGTSLHTRHASEHGLITTTTEGEKGELTRTYTGQSAVEVFHSDGTHDTFSGVVHGQGGVNADGSGAPFQSSLVVDDNGYRGDIKGEMVYNQQAGQWEMQASSEKWTSDLDAHSSGMTMYAGGWTLAGGHLEQYGKRGGGNWTYQGPVVDSNNMVSHGRVESKDGQMYFTDLDHGGNQRVIGEGGHQLLLKHAPGGNEYTYEESWTAPAFREGANGQLESIGQTHFTSRGHATVDPNKDGSILDRLMKTPDTTLAENKGAFGERSLAVAVERRPMSELTVGSGTLKVDGLSGDGSSDQLLGGDGYGYVVHAGAGSERLNAIERIQNVKTGNGRFATERTYRDSIGNNVSGSVSSVVDSRTADSAGRLESSVLARGGDGTGEFRVLTKETSNRNSFVGTYQVPELDGQGTVRVAGGIELSPEGDVVSMHFTNAATGKQISYRESERGPVFSVADVEADPNSPGQHRLTNVRELSHREAESAGGFAVRDVLNQAGETIFSHGDKGILRNESRAYQLNTKIDEQSTLVSKEQQSLEAVGLAKPFNADEPGVWKDQAIAAEGVRLGWNTSTEMFRIGRFQRSVERISGDKPVPPYDPHAPVDPAQRGIYDKVMEMRKDFEKQRGIPSRGSRRTK